jgi:hypothetical protein
VNLSSLGIDAGVSHNTVRAWLSVLETSYIVQRVPGWHPSVRKQVVKAPKLHFLDSGLVCQLLGIREPGQLWDHPLRGAIFESWVVSEIRKALVHTGRDLPLLHYRESQGLEIDLLVDHGDVITAIEIKSTATVQARLFKGLGRFCDRLGRADVARRVVPALLYAGEESQQRSAVRVVGWRDVESLAGVS